MPGSPPWIQLGMGHSAEPNAIIFGRMLYRGGVIRCRGYLIDRRCAKIQRVFRSPL